MKVVLYTLVVLGIVISLTEWSFVALAKTGRVDNCTDVVWSSSEGFNECVDLSFKR